MTHSGIPLPPSPEGSAFSLLPAPSGNWETPLYDELHNQWLTGAWPPEADAEPESAALSGVETVAAVEPEPASLAASEHQGDPVDSAEITLAVVAADEADVAPASAAYVAAAAEEADTDPEGPYQPILDPGLAERLVPQVRDGLVSEAVADVTKRVLVRKPGEYGYWEGYARSVSATFRPTYRQVRDDAVAAVLAVPAANRTEKDNFVLAVHGTGTVGLEAQVPEGVTETPYDYHKAAFERINEALAHGRLPEGFDDPAELADVIRLTILRGLVVYDNLPNDRRISMLEAAAATLQAATERVPGFDPARAGVQDLFSGSTRFRGILVAERGRFGHLHQESAQTVGVCLDAATRTIAAYQGQLATGKRQPAPRTPVQA